MEKRARFPVELKREVKKRQHSKCADCGEKVKDFRVHHIIPVALLGINSMCNAVGLCGSKCHPKWDKLAIEKGIVWPGISIDKAPRNLFTYGRKR